MIDDDELDMIAAEYVLGTLDAQSRQTVNRERLQNSELEAQIQFWEQRLSSLNEEILEVTPRAELLSLINARLDRLNPRVPQLLPDLQKRLRRWQWYSALATAASIGLVALLWLQPAPTLPEQPFVAVFQQDDAQPAFMLSVDLNSRELKLRAVTAKPQPGKSYQLWIKEDSLGPKPRSLGVLNADLSINPAVLKGYDTQLLKRATFGISLEPEGGSPTGQPTSPAIHGYLYPAARQDI